MTEPTKRCSWCREEKPYPEFHRNRGTHDGLNNECKTCRKRHNPQQTIRVKIYASQHREQERLRARNWYYQNRQTSDFRAKRCVDEHRRRTRKFSLPHTFTTTEAEAALAYWQHKCAYCKTSLNQLSMFEDIQTNFDHFIALTDPRPDNPGTVTTNMLPTCAKCNRSKHNHDPIEWLTAKYGKRKATQIVKCITEYFGILR